ncbi:hypothetical protein XENOCAPTIV_020040 [Xenoophorus captivus]|uniref:Uncharacterized protein n=1 Tax=Xenoophorus captivus TaxID=1517983 RepID=A0ABV0S9X1_9TELE
MFAKPSNKLCFVWKIYILFRNIHFYKGGKIVGCTVVQQEGPGFDSWLGISAWSLHVLPVHAWVLSGYSSFFPESKKKTKNMTVRLIGHSKLPSSAWLFVL